jgi:hypothetical protein
MLLRDFQFAIRLPPIAGLIDRIGKMNLIRLTFGISLLLLIAWAPPAVAQPNEHKTVREVLECNRRTREALPPLSYTVEAHSVSFARDKRGKYWPRYKDYGVEVIYKHPSMAIQAKLEMDRKPGSKQHSGDRIKIRNAVLLNSDKISIRRSPTLVNHFMITPDGNHSRKARGVFSRDMNYTPHFLPYGYRPFFDLDFVSKYDEIRHRHRREKFNSPTYELSEAFDNKLGRIYTVSEHLKGSDGKQYFRIREFAAEYGCALIQEVSEYEETMITLQAIHDTEYYIPEEVRITTYHLESTVQNTSKSNLIIDEETGRAIESLNVIKITNMRQLTAAELQDDDLFSSETVLYNSPLFDPVPRRKIEVTFD